MNFRKVNNLTGWAVFLVAMATYMLTREARGSLWDCGEFVSSAYKMELPHPPGAPMFTLLGRFFIILFGDNGQTAANAVNFMSALASAATILFLFWSITHFARKMFVNAGEQLTGEQTFITMSAGVVGALAYTFSDSFWFSAVEGEVYALSSFFTALVFWAALKWEHADEHAGNSPAGRARADRWIIFLFFMMGLSIGVHLLNLLTIPAIVMIYYFRRYFKHEPFKADIAAFKKDQVLIWDAIVSVGLVLLLVIANVLNAESDLIGVALLFAFIGIALALIRIYSKYKAVRSMISAFAIGCIIVGIVQVGVIQYSMKSAGLFDVFFKNSLSFPFYGGFTFYFLALAALIVWALRFNEKNINRTKMIIWFILFLVLSALPFFVSMKSEVGNVFKFLLVAGIATLIGYFFKGGGLRVLKLSLWCYAFMILGYFMYFTVMIRSNANPTIDMNNVDNPISLVYYLSREQYGSAPLFYGPHFDARANDVKEGEMRYIKGEKRYIAVGRNKENAYPPSEQQFFPRIWDPSDDQGHRRFYIQWLGLEPQSAEDGTEQYKPTYADNAEFFITYQMGLMYWRYFMWNFAGKQNDNQGFGNVRDGNWITGIPIIDNTRLGDQSKLPDSIKNNNANNKLFMLPFILGIVGCVYQLFRNKRDWAVTFLLFLLTGMAIVLYLNQPGFQPRERDYAYVGSFYAFAIWIGLSVIAFVKMARDVADKKGFVKMLLYGSVITFLVTIMSSLRGTPFHIFFTGVLVTGLFALVTLAITYLARTVSSQGQNTKLLNIATTLICLIVPLLMAQQEWDDHDRSKKTLAPDLARNYLESCAPNAVIFTFGDNDTYPLWYAQEVEGVRPDIRIINYSLLGIDWYINQLRYKVNEAAPLDVIWSPAQMEGGKRDYAVYRTRPNIPNTIYYELYDLMKNYIGSDDPNKMEYSGGGDLINTYPVTKVFVPVDTNVVRANKTVNPGDTLVNRIQFELPARYMQKNDLAMLNIIAANKWERPIYFTSLFDNLGFGKYLRKDGLSYRLVPVKPSSAPDQWVFNIFQSENNLDAMTDNLMNKFTFTSKKGVYFDEENRRHALNIRTTYGETAGSLADAGRKDEAVKLLAKSESMIPESMLPYAMTSRDNYHNINGLTYLEAAYKVGNVQLAEKIKAALKKDFEQQRQYYDYIRANREEFYTGFGGRGGEVERNDYFSRMLGEIEKKYSPQPTPTSPVETNPPTIINKAAQESLNKKSNTPIDTSKKPK